MGLVIFKTLKNVINEESGDTLSFIRMNQKPIEMIAKNFTQDYLTLK